MLWQPVSANRAIIATSTVLGGAFFGGLGGGSNCGLVLNGLRSGFSVSMFGVMVVVILFICLFWHFFGTFFCPVSNLPMKNAAARTGVEPVLVNIVLRFYRDLSGECLTWL